MREIFRCFSCYQLKNSAKESYDPSIHQLAYPNITFHATPNMSLLLYQSQRAHSHYHIHFSFSSFNILKQSTN